MVSDAEAAVLDSRAFQRLRQIKQLGFAEFSFPGATHNRFLHSLGASHLACRAFDQIFADYKFSKPKVRRNLRQCLKLASLLHDVGHGPLSHTTEEVMPLLKDLNLPVYGELRDDISIPKSITRASRQANHEDYTIKFITDSSLTKVLEKNFKDFSPLHIACLIDKSLKAPDDFFIDQGVDIRSLLSQIVSSELDVDRMDYLERDAYYCGTNYGRVELNWLLDNLTYHIRNDQMFLAIGRRALYAFDDFLLARHHMNLMVYFHHKSIIYEEMLIKYLTSDECSFYLPADIEEYTKFTDYKLYEHLSNSDNYWAKRITNREIYKVLFELHATEETQRISKMKKEMEKADIPVIHAGSSIRLSKYHSSNSVEKSFPIFVVDPYDQKSKPYPIEQSTKIFQKYDEIRHIERLYVPPEKVDEAREIILSKNM